ncbi:MAG: hypothetical protein Q7U75_05345, partial [Desulfobacterales bacterium]|nr:hypothetical protein [Desulfobacterales bacterium]
YFCENEFRDRILQDKSKKGEGPNPIILLGGSAATGFLINESHFRYNKRYGHKTKAFCRSWRGRR